MQREAVPFDVSPTALVLVTICLIAIVGVLRFALTQWALYLNLMLASRVPAAKVPVGETTKQEEATTEWWKRWFTPRSASVRNDVSGGGGVVAV
jgi:hypothetical protein